MPLYIVYYPPGWLITCQGCQDRPESPYAPARYSQNSATAIKSQHQPDHGFASCLMRFEPSVFGPGERIGDGLHGDVDKWC